MTCREIHPWEECYHAALALREGVLRTPLGMTLSSDDLALDARCFHLAAFEGAVLVAVLLLLPVAADQVKMRQFATLPEWQRRGVGTKLLAFAEQFTARHGYHSVVAHARDSALGFYLRNGYEISGECFLEVTVPHRRISKTIASDH